MAQLGPFSVVKVNGKEDRDATLTKMTKELDDYFDGVAKHESKIVEMAIKFMGDFDAKNEGKLSLSDIANGIRMRSNFDYEVDTIVAAIGNSGLFFKGDKKTPRSVSDKGRGGIFLKSDDEDEEHTEEQTEAPPVVQIHTTKPKNRSAGGGK